MTTTTRRAILARAATAAAALPLASLPAAAGPAEPDPIYAAIERDRAAKRAYEATHHVVDDLEEAGESGWSWHVFEPEPPANAEASCARWLPAQVAAAAAAREDALAYCDLAHTVPSTLPGLLALVRYLDSIDDRDKFSTRFSGHYNEAGEPTGCHFGTEFIASITDALEQMLAPEAV